MNAFNLRKLLNIRNRFWPRLRFQLRRARLDPRCIGDDKKESLNLRVGATLQSKNTYKFDVIHAIT